MLLMTETGVAGNAAGVLIEKLVVSIDYPPKTKLAAKASAWSCGTRHCSVTGLTPSPTARTPDPTGPKLLFNGKVSRPVIVAPGCSLAAKLP